MRYNGKGKENVLIYVAEHIPRMAWVLAPIDKRGAPSGSAAENSAPPLVTPQTGRCVGERGGI